MTFRSKSLLIASVVFAAAFAVLMSSLAHNPTVAADGPRSTVVKKYAPAFETDRIAPADVLGTGTPWMPATGEN